MHRSDVKSNFPSPGSLSQKFDPSVKSFAPFLVLAA